MVRETHIHNTHILLKSAKYSIDRIKAAKKPLMSSPTAVAQCYNRKYLYFFCY